MPGLDNVVTRLSSYQPAPPNRLSELAAQEILKGRTVVELGAGLGLCSVAAAHAGARVGVLQSHCLQASQSYKKSRVQDSQILDVMCVECHISHHSVLAAHV